MTSGAQTAAFTHFVPDPGSSGAKPASFRLIASLDFRAGGNAEQFTRAGFSYSEATHTWALSPRADLALPSAGDAGSAFVVFRFEDVFCHPRALGLRVIARLSGHTVFEDALHGAALIGLPVPDAVLRDDAMMLSFEFPGAVSPREAGHAEARPLTARFGAVWLVAGPPRTAGPLTRAEEASIRLCLDGHCPPHCDERVLWRGFPKVCSSIRPIAGRPASPANAGRESVVFVGNCLAGLMKVGLSAHPASTSFRFEEVPVNIRSIADNDAIAALEAADWVFLQGIVRAALQDRVKAMVPTSCRIVIYPDMVLRNVWPFLEGPGHDRLRVAREGSGFIHVDGALERLRTLEPDRSRRIKAYEAMSHGLAESVARVAAAQERFLFDIDREHGTGLGAVVSRNFREHRLFYDSVHPSATLSQAMCRFVLSRVGFLGGEGTFGDMDGFASWSVPVHPVIADNLGLTWAGAGVRFRYGALGDVTWREWVEAYIDTYG